MLEITRGCIEELRVLRTDFNLVVLEQPGRKTAEIPFRTDIRSRPKQDQKPFLLSDFYEPSDVVAVGEVEMAGPILNGVPKDVKRGIEIMEQLAAKGNSEALYGIGLMYQDGNGVLKDLKKAYEYFQLGADLGDSEACYMVGYCYFKGLGVERDYPLACSIFAFANSNSLNYLIFRIVKPHFFRWLKN